MRLHVRSELWSGFTPANRAGDLPRRHVKKKAQTHASPPTRPCERARGVGCVCLWGCESVDIGHPTPAFHTPVTRILLSEKKVKHFLHTSAVCMCRPTGLTTRARARNSRMQHLLEAPPFTRSNTVE